MTILDYYTKTILATFNGTNPRDKQLCAWLNENNYLVHHIRNNRIYVIK
jgi:hypothetical protein